jgi:hypothetical protein
VTVAQHRSRFTAQLTSLARWLQEISSGDNQQCHQRRSDAADAFGNNDNHGAEGLVNAMSTGPFTESSVPFSHHRRRHTSSNKHDNDNSAAGGGEEEWVQPPNVVVSPLRRSASLTGSVGSFALVSDHHHDGTTPAVARIRLASARQPVFSAENAQQLFSHLASHAPKRCDSSLLRAIRKSPAASGVPRVLLVAEGVDELEAGQLSELASLLRSLSHVVRVSVLASVSDPEFFANAPVEALDFFRFAWAVHTNPRTAFLSRGGSVVPASVVLGEHELGTTRSGGGSRGDAGPATGSGHHGMSSLPLRDTIYRILLSLPEGFLPLLRVMIDLQVKQLQHHAEQGGGGRGAPSTVWMPMSVVTDALDKAGTMVGPARLKALLRELTSNRLAQYDVSRNAVCVPQQQLVLAVLAEVEQERALKRTTAAPAPGPTAAT